jgi:hypothetical protein
MFRGCHWVLRLNGKPFCGELKECKLQRFCLTSVECHSPERARSQASAACRLRLLNRQYAPLPNFRRKFPSGLSFFADWHALEFVNQGGTVAYGMVPTRPGLNAVDSATIFMRWLKAASLAGDPQRFAQRAMITATCGLGLLDTSSVAESFSVAHSISKLIRSLAGSPEQ